MLFFEIDDNKNIVGLTDVLANAEAISRLIKERITPYPSFILASEKENGRDVLGLSMSAWTLKAKLLHPIFLRPYRTIWQQH